MNHGQERSTPGTERIYPDCTTIRRKIDVGGNTKLELIQELQRNTIFMNEYAEKLFASNYFTTSATRYPLMTIELAVRNLGFPRAATITEIYERAKLLRLGICPLELAPYLRLHYIDQPEGHSGEPIRRHQAPYGSITIVSENLPDDDFPKGFYLRRIEGVLWLRGYCSGPQHLWSAEDHLVFCQND
jgi:hypothetical protein